MVNTGTGAWAQSPQYELSISPRAMRDLDRLSSNDFRRVDARIQALATNPRPPGVAKLWNSSFRIRIGPWREIYVVDDANRNVIIDAVRRRDTDTYR